jgi:mRNA-degrading endonuclease toxin of MazEF toxin-antitoxin module
VKGQLHWVDLDGDGTRLRPYLIIQSDELNAAAPTTIGLPVTPTRQRAGYPLTLCLEAGEAGLEPPTWIRLTQPSTLRCDQLIGHIGTLSPQRLDETQLALREILDLG